MEPKDSHDDETDTRRLEGLFAQAAASSPRPSSGLMDRVLADALAQQAPPLRRLGTVPRPGLLARLVALIGGAPVLAGACSAAVIGVTLGYLDPGTLDMLTGGGVWAATETLDLFPSSDFLSTEG
jgi:hypothetical protein